MKWTLILLCCILAAVCAQDSTTTEVVTSTKNDASTTDRVDITTTPQSTTLPPVTTTKAATTTKKATTTTKKPTTTTKKPTTMRSTTTKKPTTLRTTTTTTQDPSITDEDREQAKKLQELEKTMKNMMDEVIKRILPVFTRASSEISLSSKCSGAMLSLLTGIRGMKTWALRMFDANSKPASGLFEGTTSALGSYDECLNITHRSFKGQYCMIDAVPPKPPKNIKNVPSSEILREGFYYINAIPFMSLRFGVCVPSHCTEKDLTTIAEYMAPQFNAKASVLYCETDEKKEMNDAQYIVAIIFCILAAVITLGTLLDILIRLVNWVAEEEFDKKKKRLEFPRKIVTSLSFYANMKKLLAKETDQTFSCLHGVKVITMLWTILAHCYTLHNYSSFRKYRDLYKMLNLGDNLALMPFLNATNIADTFYFISGLLVMYTTWKILDKIKTKSHMKFLPVLIVMRVYRLIIAVAFIVGLVIVLPLTGRGPLWNESIGGLSEGCVNYWWATIFFFNNYEPVPGTCLPHTSFISAMLQMYIISLFIVAIWYRWPFMGMFVNFLVFAIGILITGILTYKWDLPPTIVAQNRNDSLYMLPPTEFNLYVSTHISAHCVGLLFGYFVLRYQKKKLGWIQKAGFEKSEDTIGRPYCFSMCAFGFLWALSIVTGLALIYGPQEWYQQKPISTEMSVFFAMINRPVFALAVGWPIFACITGRGGIVNSFLSWSGWRTLSRVTYVAYIMHVVVIILHTAAIRELVSYNHWELVQQFFAYTVTIYVLSVFITVAVEMPFLGLQGIFTSWLKDRLENPETQKANDIGLKPLDKELNGDTEGGHTNPAFVYRL